MRPTRVVRDHPLALLAGLALAFAGWVASDATAPRDRAPGLALDLADAPPPGPRVRQLPPPPDSAGVVTPEVLARLKPGMTRAEVEELVGPPGADYLRPVAEDEGGAVYSAAYPAEFDAPAPNTVRPIPGRAAPKPAAAAPRSLVALDFDAARPGHPLVGVRFPDPLF